ncbi:MAG: penicillin-insensitive murein endopeptidase [Solirubrobacteraceae bacterium]|nr:penicillin-insensitive murein endopeptidase [Solirubrobacteraceae bacterium]
MKPVRHRSAAPTAALVVACVALGGCAGGSEAPIEQVRVLRLTPAALITKQAPAREEQAPAQDEQTPTRDEQAPARDETIVRASVVSAPRSSLPPPMSVPDVGSIAAGATNDGRLLNGLLLPGSGPDWVTYDPGLGTTPSRAERRWGTDRLLAFLLYVLRDYRLANPGAPPVVIGDLSRPHGGPFGSDHGGLGHVSHQNGLDVDVFYPRRDRALLPPTRVAQVDRVLAQDLVDRFVAAGAQYAFVGLNVGLVGPPQVVRAIPHHDDHIHVRIAGWRR